MKFTTTEQITRTATIAIDERIDAFTAPALREHLENLFEDGVTDFVIDLSDTPFMDSAGMAVLVSTLKRSRLLGGSVKLVWPGNEAVQRILRLTRFDRVFEIVPGPQPAQVTLNAERI